MSIEIIAEVAQGYEGNQKLSQLLALGAVNAGADAVKYQIIFADELCIKIYPYYDLFKSLEMDEQIWRQVVDIVRRNGKKMYFDIYGEKSFELARKLKAAGVKISTTDFYNRPLIKKAISTFEKVFISIGGVPVEELDELMGEIEKGNITLMFGFQAEPTPIEENNLLRIRKLKERYPYVPFGFMDHSLGTSKEALYLPLMAAAMGIACIEKHITLDPALQIEDYISGLEPKRFGKFVNIIKTMEKALGNPELVLTKGEEEYKNKAGKVIVAKADMKAGEIIQEESLTLKRISLDGSPECFRKITDLLGKKLKSNVNIDEPLTRGLV